MRASTRVCEHSKGTTAAYVAAVAPPSMSTGFATVASAGRSSASACAISAPSVASSRPAACMRPHRGSPARRRSVSTAMPWPRGSGCCVERSAATSTSSSSETARITAWVEERVDRSLRAGECSRWELARPPSARARAALQGQDRLAAGDTACEWPELGRGLPKDSTYIVDELPPTRRPPTTRAGRAGRDVGLVADRHERREPEATRTPPPRAGRRRGRAALGRKADAAGRRRACRERRVEAGPAVAIPRQLGPISRAPCERTSASSRSPTPSLPISAKPAEMTTRARVPARSACSAASSTAAPGSETTATSMVSDFQDGAMRARRPPVPRRG